MVIEFFHHRLDFLIRDAFELSFFREVLSDESIVFSTGMNLPGN